MPAFIPYMNPFKFYNPNKRPDYFTYWPHADNMLPREKYSRGQDPADYYREHLVDKVVRFQCKLDSVSNTDVAVYKWDVINSEWTDLATNASKTVLNPAGWNGLDTYKFEYTPTSEGIYQFRFKGLHAYSDPIFAINRLKHKRGLLQIEYWNSSNEHSMIFVDNGVNIYKGLVYISGNEKTGGNNTDIVGFEDDPNGHFEKLRTTSQPQRRFELTDVHWTYRDFIEDIFKCDNIVINTIHYQNPDPPEIEEIENSDLINVRLQARKIQTDSYYELS